jgi:phosphate transport system permease protein
MGTAFTSKKKTFTDEIFVWFTGMGLTIGLAMIVFLLGLVLVNGYQVFWPKRVAEVRLADGGVLGGEMAKRKEKAVRSPNGLFEDEIQLYVGNKEIYGYSFKYVDEAAVSSVSYPSDALAIERLEYGDAFGYPTALKMKDGSQIPFDNPLFEQQLGTLVSAARRRWDQIRHIEKKQIGDINQRMEKIRIREKTAPPSELQRLHAQKEELQKKYQVLADNARRLRAEQNENTLLLKLISGQDKSIPSGQIVDYYYANRLNVGQRVWRSLRGFWTFLADEPREANTEGGIFPAIFGTFVMTLIMSVAVTPFGVIAAIYLREYAKQGPLVRMVRIAVNNLAGVPSIVFGVFGLGFFVYFVGGSIDALFFKDKLPTPTFGTGGILWCSLTLALMTVPVVIVATEEALAAVARGVREGSLACGASKWQTIQHVVLPASAPGIMTGLILAMARGAGEVAPLMLVGVVKLAPTLPLDLSAPFMHFDRKFMHLGFHIYDLGFQSPDSEAAKPMVFATTLLLIALVVILNMTAITIRERLRRKYAVGAF